MATKKKTTTTKKSNSKRTSTAKPFVENWTPKGKSESIPILHLPKDDEGKYFERFGLGKAELFVMYADNIKEFYESNGKKC